MRLKKSIILFSLFFTLMAVCAVSGWAEVAGKININTASEAELTQLTGVGSKTAESIITYRKEISPFQTIEDLMKVKGIGEKTFEKIKDRITVGESAKGMTIGSKKKG